MSLRLRAFNRAGLLLAAVLLADQFTKAAARSALEPGDEDPIFPALKLVHVRNDGVAFGAFGGSGIIVPLIVTIAMAGLVAYFATHADRPLAWVPTGLLMGGAIGNLIDRVRDGAVTDFLKLPAWPAFNIADIAITFGVLALLYVIERGDRDGDPRPA